MERRPGEFNGAGGRGRGGVLGMMHALAARRRGFKVVHLEREPDSRGASVRNFGLVCASAPEL
jgi:glycine/D-amino acid oxidase-like deaminating enzyme